nr:immunoglobulin light chain junction region [Macaca mulatta]MOY01930.1 immunoglobulin light chain junction region [Macaca mulatta]
CMQALEFPPLTF